MFDHEKFDKRMKRLGVAFTACMGVMLMLTVLHGFLTVAEAEAAINVQQEAINVQRVSTRVRAIDRLDGQVIELLPASYKEVRICMGERGTNCVERLVLDDVLIVWRGPGAGG